MAYIPRQFTAAGAPGNEKGVGTSDPRDRVTADLLLLEAPRGWVAFGGSPEWEQQPTPHYLQVAAPARFEGVWISNSNIVRALAPGGRPLAGQMVLGRIVRSNVGQRPFNLMSVEGTPDMDRAVQIYSALSMGQVAYQSAQPIPGVPQPVRQQAQQAQAAAPIGYPQPPAPAAPMPPAAPAYGAAPVPSPGYPQPPAPAQGFPAAPGWPAPPQAAVPPVPPALAAAFPGAAPMGYPQPQAAPPAPPVPQAPLQVPAPAPALPPHLLAQGWTPETWATLSEAQRSMVLAGTPG